jgi:hypothetical protein
MPGLVKSSKKKQQAENVMMKMADDDLAAEDENGLDDNPKLEVQPENETKLFALKIGRFQFCSHFKYWN